MKQPRTQLSRTVADKALKSGASAGLAKEVAAYLLTENRVGELDSVLRDIQNDWAEAGYVEVLAYSAHPLNAAIRSQIDREVKQVYPDAKKIIITEIAEPTVIGGVRIKLPNKQLDLSIESKLHKFKQLTSTGKE